jgi:hypothetical protein
LRFPSENQNPHPMKKLFFFLALLTQVASCIVSTAQTIRFTDITNRWKVRTTIYPDDVPVTSHEIFEIDDTTYEWNGNFYSVIRGENGQTLYVREDTIAHKVYLAPVTKNIGLYIATDTTTEFTYMDFSLLVGDTFSFPIRNNSMEEQDSLSRYFVASIDSAQLGAKWYKQMLMQRISGMGYYADDTYTITEGIGFGLSYGFWVGPTILTYLTGEWKPNLVCFSNNDSIPDPPFYNNCFDPVGIQEQTKNSDTFLAYPNPAHDMVHVELHPDVKNLVLDLMDLTGKRLQRHTVQNQSLSLNVENLAEGIYILKLSGDNIKATYRKLKVY